MLLPTLYTTTDLFAEVPGKDPDLVTREIWSGVSAAILARAAAQHCRLLTTMAMTYKHAVIDTADPEADADFDEGGLALKPTATLVYERAWSWSLFSIA